MNESIPSSVQPPQAAQKLRVWLAVNEVFNRDVSFAINVQGSLLTQVGLE
jgi:hypothetical protein